MWDDIAKLKGGPKPEFLEEHGLDDESTPQEWFKAFLPVFDGTTNNPRQSNTPYWTHPIGLTVGATTQTGRR